MASWHFFWAVSNRQFLQQGLFLSLQKKGQFKSEGSPTANTTVMLPGPGAGLEGRSPGWATLQHYRTAQVLAPPAHALSAPPYVDSGNSDVERRYSWSEGTRL